MALQVAQWQMSLDRSSKQAANQQASKQTQEKQARANSIQAKKQTEASKGTLNCNLHQQHLAGISEAKAANTKSELHSQSSATHMPYTQIWHVLWTKPSMEKIQVSQQTRLSN